MERPAARQRWIGIAANIPAIVAASPWLFGVTAVIGHGTGGGGIFSVQYKSQDGKEYACSLPNNVLCPMDHAGEAIQITSLTCWSDLGAPNTGAVKFYGR